MALLSLHEITLSFGHPALLEEASFQLERGERVALIGRNGSGKSTLLRCLAGDLLPNSGLRHVVPGLTIATLSQEISAGLGGTVYQVVAGGLPVQGELLTEYHYAAHQVATDPTPDALRVLEKVQHRLEVADAWQVYQRVERTLSDLSLDGEMHFDICSGGTKRRVLLARALVGEPDLLLLDEPTNHLDLETIAWLEERLLRFQGTLVIVTHDRMLVRRLATRVLEIDRGRLTSWACDYDTYRARKQQQLEADAVQWATFEKKWEKEEEWVRKGIKARRTRNEGRVRALERMRALREARRQEMGAARMKLQKCRRSGDMVIETEELSFSFVDRPIVRNLSTRIVRKDKIGILGPNGSGKTTLLRLLLGELAPDAGTVDHGTELQVVYYDQLRSALDPEQTVLEAVTDGREVFYFDGRATHVYAYLENFLFPRDRVNMPVGALSGGERNRLVLARLFTRPSNVLVLDEPTNDLDVETLELLEQLLADYDGTLLLVSHDREFLNNVVTSTMALEGKGQVVEYAGGYDDWVAQRRQQAEEQAAERPKPAKPERPRAERPRRLTFKEAAELEAIEPRIEALEQEKNELFTRMSDPAFYRAAGDKVAATRQRIADIEKELATAYARWEELETIRSN
jgi:ATP-binding cassette subfamily F protein uup